MCPLTEEGVKLERGFSLLQNTFPLSVNGGGFANDIGLFGLGVRNDHLYFQVIIFVNPDALYDEMEELLESHMCIRMMLKANRP